jgi:hypothetical protein
MKIRPVGDELFDVDRLTEGHDEVNSRFPQFFRKDLKMNMDVKQKL